METERELIRRKAMKILFKHEYDKLCRKYGMTLDDLEVAEDRDE